MFLINNLTVVIVTYKTNDQILEECIESILGKAKILIIEKSDTKDFKLKYNPNSGLYTNKVGSVSARNAVAATKINNVSIFFISM